MTARALPPAVRLSLESRGCTIPQTYAERAPHNVTVGSIMGRGGTDWAVLCSVQRVSRVLIFPSGQADHVVEWESSDDLGWLQGIGDGAIGYSRAIDVVSPESIHKYAKDDLPNPLDHDGIDEAFIEKGSTIHYWNGSDWLNIPGSD